MDTITLEEAQERLPDLVEQAVGGRDIVITKDDTPVVRLVAVARPKSKPRFGSAKGLITMADDFDAPLADLPGRTLRADLAAVIGAIESEGGRAEHTDETFRRTLAPRTQTRG